MDHDDGDLFDGQDGGEKGGEKGGEEKGGEGLRGQTESMSMMVISLMAKTMALGGVPMGSMKAKLVEIVVAIMNAIGLYCVCMCVCVRAQAQWDECL